jgi:hypothetical protein
MAPTPQPHAWQNTTHLLKLYMLKAKVGLFCVHILVCLFYYLHNRCVHISLSYIKYNKSIARQGDNPRRKQGGPSEGAGVAGEGE